MFELALGNAQSSFWKHDGTCVRAGNRSNRANDPGLHRGRNYSRGNRDRGNCRRRAAGRPRILCADNKSNRQLRIRRIRTGVRRDSLGSRQHIKSKTDPVGLDLTQKERGLLEG